MNQTKANKKMMKRNIIQSLSTGNAFQSRTTRPQEAKTMLPFGGGTNAEFQKVRPQLENLMRQVGIYDTIVLDQEPTTQAMIDLLARDEIEYYKEKLQENHNTRMQTTIQDIKGQCANDILYMYYVNESVLINDAALAPGGLGIPAGQIILEPGPLSVNYPLSIRRQANRERGGVTGAHATEDIGGVYTNNPTAHSVMVHNWAPIIRRHAIHITRDTLPSGKTNTNVHHIARNTSQTQSPCASHVHEIP
jgi:hypothetical protein